MTYPALIFDDKLTTVYVAVQTGVSATAVLLKEGLKNVSSLSLLCATSELKQLYFAGSIDHNVW